MSVQSKQSEAVVNENLDFVDCQTANKRRGASVSRVQCSLQSKHTALQLQDDARYAKRTLARRAAATVTATLLTMVERALALSEEEAGAKGFALAPAAPLLIPRREDAVVGSRGETPIERGVTLTLVTASGAAAMGVTALAGVF